jgi:four helix bundle protein
MQIQRFEDLRCWQLADELRTHVTAICHQPDVEPHKRFCESFSEAIGSVCRNLAEGFDRRTKPDRKNFIGYALASLSETQDHLRECKTRKFIDEPRFAELYDIAEHTRAVTLRWRSSL